MIVFEARDPSGSCANPNMSARKGSAPIPQRAQATAFMQIFKAA
jgi:hypothetical protein